MKLGRRAESVDQEIIDFPAPFGDPMSPFSVRDRQWADLLPERGEPSMPGSNCGSKKPKRGNRGGLRPASRRSACRRPRTAGCISSRIAGAARLTEPAPAAGSIVSMSGASRSLVYSAVLLPYLSKDTLALESGQGPEAQTAGVQGSVALHTG